MDDEKVLIGNPEKSDQTNGNACCLLQGRHDRGDTEKDVRETRECRDYEQAVDGARQEAS